MACATCLAAIGLYDIHQSIIHVYTHASVCDRFDAESRPFMSAGGLKTYLTMNKQMSQRIDALWRPAMPWLFCCGCVSGWHDPDEDGMALFDDPWQ